MGSLHSKLNQQTKQTLKLFGGITLIVSGGLIYYRWQHKSKTKPIKLTKTKPIKIKFICEPAEDSDRQSGGTEESIIFCDAKGEGDRRHKIVTGKQYNNQQFPDIFECIGRVIWADQKINMAELEIEKEVKVKASTGTVFKTEKSSFLVVTCAHAICDHDTTAKHVYFLRQQTFEPRTTEPVTKKIYEMISLKKLDYTTKSQCPNDLAVLEFQDTDRYYKAYTKKIHLFSADDLPKQALTYNIYGYPCVPSNSDDQKTDIEDWKKINDGELWGMRAKSFIDNPVSLTKTIPEQYVERKREKLVYNAIDTQKGQSGAAIFICLQSGHYAIVGIHTSGAKKHRKYNVGIALTETKINALLSKRLKAKDIICNCGSKKCYRDYFS